MSPTVIGFGLQTELIKVNDNKTKSLFYNLRDQLERHKQRMKAIRTYRTSRSTTATVVMISMCTRTGDSISSQYRYQYCILTKILTSLSCIVLLLLQEIIGNKQLYSVITNMFVDESNSHGVVLCQLIELKLPTFNVDIDNKHWNQYEIATPPPPHTPGWWINRSFIEYRWVRIRANDSLLLSASNNLSREGG